MTTPHKPGDKVRVRNWPGEYTVASRLRCGGEWLYFITDAQGNGTYMNGPIVFKIDEPAPDEQGAQLTIF